MDNPLLTLLGRRGRGAVVEALRRAPGRTWSVRDLARAADVPPMVATRAVRELKAVGAVEVGRPGRNASIRLDPASAAARFLSAVDAPDLRSQAAAAFAAACAGRAGIATLLWWAEPGEDPADPLVPLRVAAVARRGGQEAALEAVGAGLDAVRAAGFPAPEVAVVSRDDLRGEDAVAAALRAGRPIPASPSA